MPDDTPAHEQALTLHIVASIPEHPPRETDPHYHLFEQAKARLKRQGLWKCVLGDDYCAGGPELHHSHLEFSQIDASDRDKVNQALGLHLDDDDAFQAWAESPGNLEVLCLTGDTPVLMADGSRKALATIIVGDLVLGHDRQAHPVTMTAVSEFRGELVALDGVRMTGNHPVLTPGGWRPAVTLRRGDLVAMMSPAGAGGQRGQLRMLGADVRGLARVEPKVPRPVVRAVPVDVVDPFGAGQRAAEHRLHDQPVLHHEAALAGRPVNDPDVPLGGVVPLVAAAAPAQPGERGQAARVGAESVQAALDPPDLDVHLAAAGLAAHPGPSRTLRATPTKAAQRRARRVPLGELHPDEVVVAAGDALLNDPLTVAISSRWWSPVLHVERHSYIGSVYDIGVAGCRSFVAGALVVHNCVAHHRTAFGVHAIPGPLWEPMRFRKAGLEPPAHSYTAAQWAARRGAAK